MSQGKVSLVDDELFESAMKYRWHVKHHKRKHVPDSYYARRQNSLADRKAGSPNTQYLHHFVYGEITELDHIDGDGLNNQLSNLRPATRAQNCVAKRSKVPWATSKYWGVSWNKNSNKWTASIGINNKAVRIGSFVVEEDAARAYDAVAREVHGEFAHLNFP